MQEHHPNTDRHPVTQPPIVHWNEEERRLLEAFARRKARKLELLRSFPGRTITAIKVRLSVERKRLGIVTPNAKNLTRREGTTMLHPNDPGIRDSWQKEWREKAVEANAAHVAALKRLAA